jgi:hypothetical protein
MNIPVLVFRYLCKEMIALSYGKTSIELTLELFYTL